MIVIATDSTACLTKQEAHQLGVIYVPMTYTLCGKTYTERFIGANGDFVSLLEAEPNPHTSQPAIGRYLRTFKTLRKAGFEVLCLTISSRLSGTFSNASACAHDLGDDGIRVVDTRTTAIGLAFLVREARRLISAGATLAEAAEQITQMRAHVKTVFSVSDMGPLRRSGRLGPVRQSVSTILNIRPLLTCRDGAVVSCGITHGPSDQLRQLARAVPEHALEVAVQYIAEQERARELAGMVCERRGGEVMMRRLCPVLGIHLGTTVLGTMWFEEGGH